MPRTKHIPVSIVHDSAEYEPRADETLGVYLRRVRTMRGLNLPDVSRALAGAPPTQRVSHAYLSQIELGQVFQPSRDRLQSLAQVLQIKPEWLFAKAGLPLSNQERPLPVHTPIVMQIMERAALLEPFDLKMLLQIIDWVISRRVAKEHTESQRMENLPNGKEL